jgi:hypothetical protein
MEISKAEVMSSWDVIRPSQLICHILESTPDSWETVKYTSPFNNVDAAGGGFTGYPREGDLVLIVKPSNGNEWYYMSTIVGVDVTTDYDLIVNPAKGSAIDPEDTRMRSVGLKGNANQHLEFVDKATETTKTQGISLTDGSDGKITMVQGFNSSVNVEAHDARLKLSKSGNSVSTQNPPATLLAEATGNSTVLSKSGALRLTVGPTGRKINIHNMASRFAMKAGPWDLEAGDIDITSDRNSVNIRAMSYLAPENPSVYIEANRVIPTSVVQIRAGGNIDLIANAAVPGVGGISLETTGDIKLLAGGQVYINGTTVNLNNPEGFTPKIPTLSNYEKTLGFVPGA